MGRPLGKPLGSLSRPTNLLFMLLAFCTAITGWSTYKLAHGSRCEVIRDHPPPPVATLQRGDGRQAQRRPLPRCPARLKNLLFTHTPKAAGTMIREALLYVQHQGANSSSIQKNGHFKACPVSGIGHTVEPALAFPYNFWGLTPEQYSAAIAFARYKFGRTCQVLASHWDVSLLDHIDNRILADTLLITSIRHPVDRLFR